MTARERAAALGLAQAKFKAADVNTVELADASLDAVLARWSVIYVADVQSVLTRLRRALVPGGSIALTAWAPPEANPWITVPMEALARVHPVPKPDPNAPGIFHLSADGALADTRTKAGELTEP